MVAMVRVIAVAVLTLATAFGFETSLTSKETIYAKVESGKCDPLEGWEPITTPDECNTAAEIVGARKCERCNDNEWRDDRPVGCRAHKGDFCCAHFNHHQHPVEYGGWAAVCRKLGKGGAKEL